jgi:hypothetical protein
MAVRMCSGDNAPETFAAEQYSLPGVDSPMEQLQGVRLQHASTGLWCRVHLVAEDAGLQASSLGLVCDQQEPDEAILLDLASHGILVQGEDGLGGIRLVASGPGRALRLLMGSAGMQGAAEPVFLVGADQD